jgi:hypothetical protein
MGVCDAHQGMAENIEHLRDGQDDLVKMSTKTALDINSMTSSVVQLFELVSQSDDRFREFKLEISGQLNQILTEVRRLKRKPSLIKIVSIVVPSLLGSGGLVTWLAFVFSKGTK